jgi:hypothetical protein
MLTSPEWQIDTILWPIAPLCRAAAMGPEAEWQLRGLGIVIADVLHGRLASLDLTRSRLSQARPRMTALRLEAAVGTRIIEQPKWPKAAMKDHA